MQWWMRCVCRGEDEREGEVVVRVVAGEGRRKEGEGAGAGRSDQRKAQASRPGRGAGSRSMACAALPLLVPATAQESYTAWTHVHIQAHGVMLLGLSPVHPALRCCLRVQTRPWGQEMDMVGARA